MARAHFVASVGAYQQQMMHIWLGQQVLNHIDRRGIEPLQVVKKQRERMLGFGEYADEPPKDRLEAGLRHPSEEDRAQPVARQ